MDASSDYRRGIIRKVRQVEIRSRRFVTESLVGSYHSVFKGRGIDFEEVREYFPGDDVRSIDWNVTAKMDRPFLKVFREERELTIMLMVDLSASGHFGSVHESKRELAAELASVLAFSATRNNDKVGLILFTDKVEKFIYPKKGRQHVLRVIREILFFNPRRRGTDIPNALNHLNRVIKRQAVTFLLSDFLVNAFPSKKNLRPPAWEALFKTLALTNRRHDLISVNLSDPRELELPDIGLITLEDLETGAQAEVNTGSEKVRLYYKKWNASRRDALERAFRQIGVDHFSISTDQPYIHSLRKFFRLREKRR